MNIVRTLRSVGNILLHERKNVLKLSAFTFRKCNAESIVYNNNLFVL